MTLLPTTRTFATMAAVATAILVSWFPLAGSAAADDSLPFTDQSANGYIGFCDQKGHQVRSGNIGAGPFVWTAVSSTPAPAGFDTRAAGKAVLIAYQPRKDVDPGDWSGKQLTASATYTNATYPMAQATGRDPALVDFVSAFPPKWDGLVQLRMYFMAPNHPQHSVPYPATVIRVSGNTWTVVSGGNVPCDAGKAVSAEAHLPSVLHGPTGRSTPGAPSRVPGSGSASKGATGSGAIRTATTSASSGEANGSIDPSGGSSSAAVDKKSPDGAGGTVAVIILVAAVLAGAATAFLRHRRVRSG
jgi:hypothetical protein